MATSTVANDDRTFINLTADPAQDRDSRRSYVRRTVMLNYHKFRRRDKSLQQQKQKPQMLGETAPGNAAHDIFASGEGASKDPVEDRGLRLSRFSRPQVVTLFEPKIWPDAARAQTSDSVIRFLRGQATKGARDLSLVAFIHRKFPRHMETETDDPEEQQPLATCQRILGVLSQQDSGSLHGEELWRKIQAHQEDIYVKIEAMGRWQTVAAIQTISLYILLRFKVDSNHEAFANGDIALLFTLGKLFRAIQVRFLAKKRFHESPPPRDDWEAWVFHESCLRASYIYFVLTLVVSMAFGLNCDGESDWTVEELTVPASKAAWEAGDEVAWRRSLDTAGPSSLPELTFADLVERGEKFRARIESWEEEADEMGLVVAMASRLHSYSSGDMSGA